MRADQGNPGRRGFSLIEVIVAITIMAILATMIVVRLTGSQDKQLSLAADQLGDLLMMYALRSEHSEVPVAISMNTDRLSISLVRRDPPEIEGGENQWQREPSVPHVMLPKFMEPEDIEVLADGDWIDISSWPLVAMPGENRPEIEINLAWEERVISLRLAPHSLYAVRRDSANSDSEIEPRMPEDLDQTGRWQEDW